jgi:uncharacterized repeat protein (TIGR01451 family)
MKKMIMKAIKSLAAISFIILLMYIPAAATTSAVTVVSMTPSNPNPGDMVAIVVSYCAQAYDDTRIMLAVSQYNMIQANNTAGQTFKVDENGTDVGGTGAGDSSVNGGYNTNDNPSTAQCYTLTFNINIPTTFSGGGTYYIVVGARSYYTAPGAGNIDSQNYLQFTLPLPPPSASITKTAEDTPEFPGENILYTINYTFVNSTTFTITDTVPPNCTLVSQSVGGTSTGTTPGSTLTWAIGNTAQQKTGSVWFVVNIGAGAASSTIHNTANWTTVEIPAGGSSGDAPVVVGPAAFTLTKSESEATGVIGDTVTYAFDFQAGGMFFNSYDTFDTTNESSLFTAVSNGGPGYPGTWTWESDGNGGGYVYSPQQGTGPTNTHYPHYLRNTPTNFCFGEIEADIQIQNGTTNWDGSLTFRDNGVADNCVAYGVGISQDNSPGYLFIQKSVPGYTPLVATTAIPFTINFNQFYTVKVLVTDAGNGAVEIQASVWPQGQPDPMAWYLTYIDTPGPTNTVIPACGQVGFQGCPYNPDVFDNLKISESVHTNPRLFDTIPTSITYSGGTPASVTVNSAPVVSNGVVSWNITTQLSSMVYHYEWYGIINYCGTIPNTGSFIADNGFGTVNSNTVSLSVPVCPQTATFTPTYTITNTYTVTSTYTPTVTMTVTMTQTPSPIIPQFTLSKAESETTANIGDTVTYTITYNNTGLIDLTNLDVWDTVPAQLTDITTISPAGGNYSAATGLVSWVLADVPVSGSGTMVFSGVVSNNVNNGQVMPNTAYGTVVSGQNTVVSNTVNLTASVPELQLTPIMNYPNPFGGGPDTTTIVFGLTVQAEVDVKFFTISGELVRTMTYDELKGQLVAPQTDTQKGTNKFIWDGKNDSGNRLASGVYFYRVEAKRGNESAHYISKLAILR